MSNARQETIADIVADIRAQNQGLPEDSYALSPLVCDLLSLADRIEAAAKREREAGAEAAQICGEIGEMIGREASKNQSVTNCNRLENAEAMREALEKADAALSLISKSSWFVDANFAETIGVIEARKAIQAAHEREIAELRECMKEAIREKCPFTRMSCKHGEPCNYECGTFKWRKALQDEGGADALFLKRKDKQC